MKQILVYGDSLSWGIIPNTRRRLAFERRWPGVMEGQLIAAGGNVRVIEDCLNGRRTVWDDPFKAGRNGIIGVAQRMEVNSPLALVIVMLGTNDFQSSHQNNAFNSAQGLAAVLRAMRSAPIEPGMPIPPILVVAPPPFVIPAGGISPKLSGADVRSAGMAAAYRLVAAEEKCKFFDSGQVIASSAADGVHLDQSQHEILGRELAKVAAPMLDGPDNG